MALMITDECINCGACEPECPNGAIYEGGMEWDYDGKNFGADSPSPAGAEGFYSEDYFYVVPDKCTECKGFHEEPQCAAVCPVDCCVPDEDHVESEDTLFGKQKFMHPEWKEQAK